MLRCSAVHHAGGVCCGLPVHRALAALSCRVYAGFPALSAVCNIRMCSFAAADVCPSTTLLTLYTATLHACMQRAQTPWSLLQCNTPSAYETLKVLLGWHCLYSSQAPLLAWPIEALPRSAECLGFSGKDSVAAATSLLDAAHVCSAAVEQIVEVGAAVHIRGAALGVDSRVQALHAGGAPLSCVRLNDAAVV